MLSRSWDPVQPQLPSQQNKQREISLPSNRGKVAYDFAIKIYDENFFYVYMIRMKLYVKT